MRKRAFVLFMAAFAAAVGAGNALGQEESSGWRNTAAVYGFAAGMSGTVVVGNVTADVDMSFGDVLDNLEMGGMAAYRGETDRFAVMADFVYMGLGASKDGPLGGTAHADVDETLFEVDGAYRATPVFDVLFGMRIMDIGAKVRLTDSAIGTREAQKDETWVDPIVGARVAVPLSKTWSVVGRGDIGGFGAGSDFTWQVMGHAHWQATRVIGIAFGYRVIDIDYESGEGADLFVYDVMSSGPLAGVTFTF